MRSRHEGVSVSGGHTLEVTIRGLRRLRHHGESTLSQEIRERVDFDQGIGEYKYATYSPRGTLINEVLSLF